MQRSASTAAPAVLARRRGRNSNFRASMLAIRLGVIAILAALLYRAFDYNWIALARARFPFDDNIWSDQTSILQLWRLEHGGPLYTPLYFVNSFDYGPVYLWTLSAIHRLFGLPFSIVDFRYISIAFAMLAIVTLVGYAALLAIRTGSTPRERPLAFATITGGTAIVGFATVTHNVTYDALHPDNLLFFLIAAMFLLYGLIVAGRLREQYVWVILALGVIGVYTKLNSIVAFPMFALGLLLGNAIGKRLAIASIATYTALVGLSLAMIPPDMRAWTLSLPLTQPFEPARYTQLLQLLVVEKLWITGTIAAAAIGFYVLYLREGKRVYAIDGMPLAGILVIGLGAFFKRFGIWNNVTLIAFVAIPYAMFLLATLTQPLRLRALQPPFRVIATIAFCLMIVGYGFHNRPAPDPVTYSRMVDAQAAANKACAKHESMFVTIFPSLFLNCKDVTYGLLISWGELYSAHPEIVINGPSQLDRDPGTKMFVWLNYLNMPWPQHQWISKFHLLSSTPVAFGYGWDVYAWDATMEIYERN